MMLRRAWTRAATSLVGLILLAPVLALLASATLDIGPGPGAQVRFSLFPLVLAAYDPLTGTSCANSIAVAAAVACGSLILGVAMGQILIRWRFWGRPVFLGLFLAPAVIPPAYLALGLVGVFHLSGASASTSQSHGLFAAVQSERVWPWLVWIWAATTQASAIVLLATTRALRSLNSDRDDAARLAGASSMRIWWFLTWPALRSAVAPVVNLIFLLTLADPGPPLILGLRRSIGFQIVFLSIRPDPFPRIAGLCLFVLTITLTWRRLVLWWGRVGLDTGSGMVGPRERPHPPARESGWARNLIYGLVLASAAILAWLPMAGLARIGLAYAPSISESHPPAGGTVLVGIHRLTEEPAPTLVVHSALLGLGVALVLAALASWRPDGAFAPSARRWRKLGALLSSSVPPLVVGVGVLSLSRMANLVSLWLDTRLEWSGAARLMDLVARALDPHGAPGLALYLGVCLAHLPSILLPRFAPVGRDDPVTHRTLQARLSGAGRHRARRLGMRGPDTIPPRSILLSGVLAAIGIAPAILLAPTMDSRPIGPGIVILASGPENARSQAALLALAVIVIAVGAMLWRGMRSFAGVSASGLAGPSGEELIQPATRGERDSTHEHLRE